MPGGDGTGPAGMGPMTGRAAGYCAGYGVPGFMNPIPGGGYGGWGRGYRARGAGFWGGRGRVGGRRAWTPYYAGAYAPPYAGGYGPYGVAYGPLPGRVPGWGGLSYPTPPQPEQELAMLRDQAEYFEGALEDIRKRIEELEAETPEQ